MVNVKLPSLMSFGPFFMFLFRPWPSSRPCPGWGMWEEMSKGWGGGTGGVRVDVGAIELQDSGGAGVNRGGYSGGHVVAIQVGIWMGTYMGIWVGTWMSTDTYCTNRSVHITQSVTPTLYIGQDILLLRDSAFKPSAGKLVNVLEVSFPLLLLR